MSDFAIRSWRPEDRPQLKALWQTAFGDSDEYIDGFFGAFLRDDACVVAEADGAVVSAMYVIPGIRLFPYRKNVLTAGYTYALATLPAYRGRGIGRAVYRAACETAQKTADAACVLPAEPSLYPFYEAGGAAPFSAVREARITRAELDGAATRMAVRAPAGQYAGMREWFLSELPHAVFPEELYDLMEESGTEFFMMEGGVAAAETENGVCRIPELLAPDIDPLTAVASIARWCPAQEYIVRTPLFLDGVGERRSFVLASLKQPPAYPLPDDFWWGFGLD